MASQVNDTAILFSPVYPSPSPSSPEAKQKHQAPPPPLSSPRYLLDYSPWIPVKGKFCNAWLLNLISLFLIPHSVIKLMVCVPSASPFTCAYPSFIESSRSLSPGSSRCFSGCTVQPLSPFAACRNCVCSNIVERRKKWKTEWNKSLWLPFFISNGKRKEGRERRAGRL